MSCAAFTSDLSLSSGRVSNVTSEDDFARAVMEGLSAKEKFLSSKYFYDDAGSKMFQRIMELDDYYLTRCEKEILNNHKKEIFSILSKGTNHIQLTELGAGDGVKTKILLKQLILERFSFEYTAIDISGKALHELSDTLKELPDMRLKLIEAEYFEGLRLVTSYKKGKNVILFLGSNIGNFNEEQSIEFLKRIRKNLNPGDILLIGFDLKKDPEIILKAYNDSKGVTKAFNLNLLARINKELHANFNLSNFGHFPIYDERTGEARSYLKSKIAQAVYVKDIGKRVDFLKDELIHTEISRKYDQVQIRRMAEISGFKVIADFYDSQKYFCNSLLQA